jgi:hypothetical protein
MKNGMQKTECRELSDAELGAVSGGTSNFMKGLAAEALTLAGASNPPSPPPPTLPCDSFDIICRILS